jgi:hypothetical protein
VGTAEAHRQRHPAREAERVGALDQVSARRRSAARTVVPVRGEFNPDANSSTVRLFGADNPDAFRGLPFSGVAYDEYSQQPPNIHGEVVSKALADHLGYGIFEGTIKGKNQLYRTYEAAKHDPTWFALWQDVDTTSRPRKARPSYAIRRSMQDDLKQIAMGLMLQSEYDQEWYLSPSAAIKGAYYGKLLEDAIKAKRVGGCPTMRRCSCTTSGISARGRACRSACFSGLAARCR